MMQMGYYEIGGAIHLLDRGEYLRISVGVTSPEMAPAAKSALFGVQAVLSEADALGLFTPACKGQTVGEILLTIKVMPAHKTRTLDEAYKELAERTATRLQQNSCPTKACPYLLAMQNEDDEELLEIIEDNTLAEEGVS